MTEPMQVGKIEQLTLTNIGITTREVIRRGTPEADNQLLDLIKQVGAGHGETPVVDAYELGQRKQFQADCEAICYYCSSKNHEAAVWDEDSDNYLHKRIGGGKTEFCDASLLFHTWAEEHKDK